METQKIADENLQANEDMQNELESLYALGHLFFKQKRYEDAGHFFSTLCSLHDDIRYWLSLGQVFQAKSNYEMAYEAFCMAGLSDPEDARPPIHVMECLIAIKNYDLALDALNTAMDLAAESENPEYIYEKCEHYLNIIEEVEKGQKGGEQS